MSRQADNVKIACLQMSSTDSVADNMDYVQAQVMLAAEQQVDLLQLPENFAQMPTSAGSLYVEKAGQGKIQKQLARLARQHSLAIIAGSLAIRDDRQSKPYARCLYFNQQGDCLSSYDKVHLFDVDLGNGECYRESDRYRPGALTGINSGLVKDFGTMLGLSICYDLRFAEYYRRQVNKGAELLCVPSAFTFATGEKHWQILLCARAIENQAYVFAAAQTGQHDNGRRTWGHSMIIDPEGEILALRKHARGLLIADLDLQSLRNYRTRFPALIHQRL